MSIEAAQEAENIIEATTKLQKTIVEPLEASTKEQSQDGKKTNPPPNAMINPAITNNDALPQTKTETQENTEPTNSNNDSSDKTSNVSANTQRVKVLTPKNREDTHTKPAPDKTSHKAQPDVQTAKQSQTNKKTHSQEMPAKKTAEEIWTPVQVSQAVATEQENRRREREQPAYDFNLVQGNGSQGKVYETTSYNNTFVSATYHLGLSSY